MSEIAVPRLGYYPRWPFLKMRGIRWAREEEHSPPRHTGKLSPFGKPMAGNVSFGFVVLISCKGKCIFVWLEHGSLQKVLVVLGNGLSAMQRPYSYT